jgi:hypothetical protein
MILSARSKALQRRFATYQRRPPFPLLPPYDATVLAEIDAPTPGEVPATVVRSYPFPPSEFFIGLRWPSLSVTFGFPEPGHVFLDNNTAPNASGTTTNLATGFESLHQEARGSMRAIAALLNEYGFNLVETVPTQAQILIGFSRGVPAFNSQAITFFPTQGNQWYATDDSADFLAGSWQPGGRRYWTAQRQWLVSLGLTFSAHPLAVVPITFLGQNSAPALQATGLGTQFNPVEIAALKLTYPELPVNY